MSLTRQSLPGNFLGSEMGTLMDNIDWHSTAVGPVETWPKSLRIAVDICLGSKFPMVIWWGPDYTMLYNDAYRPMLGLSKHPQYLGKSGKDCWSEIWHILGPMMETVLQTGKATWSENLLLHLNRNNYIEETYFTFSYSPLFNDQGDVYGIFNACTETTGQVLGERRLKTLRSMIIEGKTAQEVGLRAIEKVAENPQDIPFAILYLINDAESKLTLAGITGFNNENNCRNEIDLASPINPLEMHMEKVLYSGKAAFVDDLPSVFQVVPYGPWANPPQLAIFLPVTCQGQDRLSAILILGISSYLAFDDDYKNFFDLIAGHVSTAIATARAYEEERRRVESLDELNRAKIDFFSSISHEFRTPLTLMLSPLEELIYNNAETLSPECREQLHMIQRNGLRLLKLVNTLLDFSRIEAKRVKASYVQQNALCL
ncbi:histidine kinase dimerization/phospho-acceptor domain-containing protein [Sporomusa sp.]|uniref:histidine kinase dimerization/phospho-acceptor domain-containing protein n=1 Tax=Sporomusa sp. TaxID=2078658 RepID=UPI002B592F33|nr:histidine kinase dimerization/phospho-acceptor domain-containing protein [Sporomusa sp.]HWR45311.1 histidine kinase dimerization/phospho-acceptor domain-containing protein [Sporomusa sp.]